MGKLIDSDNLAWFWSRLKTMLQQCASPGMASADADGLMSAAHYRKVEGLQDLPSVGTGNAGKVLMIASNGSDMAWESGAELPVATANANGLLHKSDKTKLDAIKSGANREIQKGRVTVANMAANSTQDVELTFSPAFSSRPHIVAGVTSRLHVEKIKISAYANTVSSGGVRLSNATNSASTNVIIDWIAVN